MYFIFISQNIHRDILWKYNKLSHPVNMLLPDFKKAELVSSLRHFELHFVDIKIMMCTIKPNNNNI